MEQMHPENDSNDEEWIEVTIQDAEVSLPWDDDPDDEVADLAVCRAPADPEEAAKALLIVVRYLRENKPLPWILRTYLARAIEVSMAKPTGDLRNSALLRELHLTAENRRPVKVLWFEVSNLMTQELQKHHGKQNMAAKAVATFFGISPATVIRLYKQHLEHTENIRRLEGGGA